MRQGRKHKLRRVLGLLRITYHSQRGGIDEIHMAAHQFGKGRFRAFFGVGAQQL